MTKHWPSDRIGKAAKAKQEPCLWVEDKDGGLFIGSCGVKWTFDVVNPRGNKMNFCIGCGKRLEQKGGEG